MTRIKIAPNPKAATTMSRMEIREEKISPQRRAGVGCERSPDVTRLTLCSGHEQANLFNSGRLAGQVSPDTTALHNQNTITQA